MCHLSIVWKWRRFFRIFTTYAAIWQMLPLPLQYETKKTETMATKNWDGDFLSQIMDEAAWKDLSGEFPWSEQLLERFQDKVDWDKMSENSTMLWTASMLEKFRNKLDWKALSRSGHRSILTAELFERFKDRWDWSELSRNSDVEMTCDLIDRFIDRWDWRELIDRYDDKLYDRAFLERYKEYIPASELQNSRLWREIVEQRKEQIAREIAF